MILLIAPYSAGRRRSPVAQTSKSAVSPVSKPAQRRTSNAQPIWKSATRQVWKPALRYRSRARGRNSSKNVASFSTVAIRDRQGRAFTLVEMLVVVLIVSIMSVAIIAEMHGTFQDALLRSTSRELATAFNTASSRAISVNRAYRVAIDIIGHRYLLERSTASGVDFFPARDVPGASGKLDPRITIKILQPGVDSPDDAGDEATATPAESDSGPPAEAPDLAAPSREPAITFYPDGTADARQIVLTDRDGFGMSLRINPITSRVQIAAMKHQ